MGSSPPNAGSPSAVPVLPPRPPRLPSLRVTSVLAVGMLAIGVAVGAAIGPAPSASFAGNPVPLLLPSIAALAESNAGGHPSTTSTVKSPAVTPQPTPAAASPSTGSTSATATKPAKSKTPSSAVSPPTKAPNTSKTPGPSTKTGEETTKQTTLPPVTHVWLITLTGGTFAQALAQPAGAPYIDSQLVPAGALLSEWSSLAGSSFAGEAALLSGEPPQTEDSIVQPPCPEGAAGETCKPETAGALSAADEFLKATVPPITASLAYRENGLIVITFGTVGNPAESSLPAGSATATLSSEPPVGVLLISPFVRPGTRPSTKYDPTSPKQSLSGLLH